MTYEIRIKVRGRKRVVLTVVLLYLDLSVLLRLACTTLHTRRLRVRFPMVSLEFFIDIILSIALWIWDRLSL
jgi:hypothetical protein